MTHVLIAADLFTLGSLFILLVVVLTLVGAGSRGHLRPLRRRYRRGFLYNDEPDNPLFGQTGLLKDLHQPNNDDLSIYKSHDHTSHSTHIDNSGSILGLNEGTEPRSVNDPGGFGDLGTAAAEYLNSDSNLSDWSSGGTFSDSGSYANDNCGSFSDSSSFSDSGSSFSDNSSGGSFSSDN